MKRVTILILLIVLVILSGCLYNPNFVENSDYKKYGGFQIPKVSGNTNMCSSPDYFTIPNTDFCLLSKNSDNECQNAHADFSWKSVPLIKYNKNICIPICNSNADCQNEACYPVSEWEIKICTPYCVSDSDCFPGLTRCSNGICTPLPNLNKPGESCGGDLEVVWSYVLPTPEDTPRYEQGLIPYNSWRVGCCKPDECINTQKVCQPYDQYYDGVNICGDENNWDKCLEETEGAFSDGDKFYCAENNNQYTWIKTEEDCADGTDDNFWDGIDCKDPTCDGKLGINTNNQVTGDFVLDETIVEVNIEQTLTAVLLDENQRTAGAGRCEYGEELTCNDGFDNDFDDTCVPKICQEFAAENNIEYPCGTVDDGCGGTKNCGGCYDILPYCVHNQCRLNPTFCGDDYCDLGETAGNCAGDCPPQFQLIPQIIGGAIQTEAKDSWLKRAITKTKDIFWGKKNALAGKAPQQSIPPSEQISQPQIPAIVGSLQEQTGIDCQDEDCIGVKGPGGAKCCLTNSNCGAGAICLPSNECMETNCNDGADNDGDGLSDCLDISNCENQPCRANSVCYQGSCTGIPEAPTATAPPQKIVEIFSYDDVLMVLSQCQVVKASGTGNSVCSGLSKTCVSFANDCSQEGNKFVCC